MIAISKKTKVLWCVILNRFSDFHFFVKEKELHALCILYDFNLMGLMLTFSLLLFIVRFLPAFVILKIKYEHEAKIMFFFLQIMNIL